jgi:hypothetical protein
LNLCKDDNCIAFFSEISTKDLINHYGLKERSNLQIIAKPASNITLKEILEISSKHKETIVFIDTLLNVIDEKNKFIGTGGEVQVANDINQLLQNAYDNDNVFFVTLSSLKELEKSLTKFHCLICVDEEDGEVFIQNDRYNENSKLVEILQNKISTNPKYIDVSKPLSQSFGLGVVTALSSFFGRGKKMSKSDIKRMRKDKTSSGGEVAAAIDNLASVELYSGGDK